MLLLLLRILSTRGAMTPRLVEIFDAIAKARGLEEVAAALSVFDASAGAPCPTYAGCRW
jgi:hypothetical protein